MRKWIVLLLLMVGLITLAACGENEDKNSQKEADDEALKQLTAELHVPETANVDEEVDISTTVLYGDDKVTDADEVVYELWEDGKKDASYKLESTNNEDGTYSLKTSFDKDGVFTVQVHVTAKDQHTMPSSNITVGEGASHDTHTDDGSANEFSLHFMEPKDVKAGAETELMSHVQMHSEPLENAEVRYEIILDGNTDWVDAKMTDNAGEYTGMYTFEEAGTYHVNVHVKDDADLHEHQEYEVVVK
ncbi:FixH family protein [Virgibacillus sp. LDC-1]|uniref:FixH family protein n=1 Tax=Virgibacillus sp. LDC-1 TaxID=3039856 RepID=UPI0024DE9338|nr:FixH family protein [Virgibacillus sp. LDC-1]